MEQEDHVQILLDILKRVANGTSTRDDARNLAGALGVDSLFRREAK